VKPRGKDDFDDSTNKLLPAYSGNRVTPLASHKIKPVVGHAVISHEIYAWSDCKQVTPLASHKIKPVVGHAVISHEIYAWSDNAAGRIFFFEDPDAPNHWIIADDLRHL
jgi:hypothetical protein